MDFNDERYIFKICNDFTIKNDVKHLLDDILNNYINKIGSPPLGFRKIEIFDKQENPFAYYISEEQDNYRINLSTNFEYRDYCSIAYEFSHEICHIYSFHSDKRYKVNNWLIESICIMSSFFYLEYLYKKWLFNPPFQNWQHYAINFFNYKAKYLEEIKFDLQSRKLNLESKVVNIFQNGLSDQYDRANTRLIALYFYDYFWKDSNYWQLLKYLPLSIEEIDKTDDYTFENSTPVLSKLIKVLPENLKYLVNNLSLNNIFTYQ